MAVTEILESGYEDVTFLAHLSSQKQRFLSFHVLSWHPIQTLVGANKYYSVVYNFVYSQLWKSELIDQSTLSTPLPPQT